VSNAACAREGYSRNVNICLNLHASSSTLPPSLRPSHLPSLMSPSLRPCPHSSLGLPRMAMRAVKTGGRGLLLLLLLLLPFARKSGGGEGGGERRWWLRCRCSERPNGGKEGGRNGVYQCTHLFFGASSFALLLPGRLSSCCVGAYMQSRLEMSTWTCRYPGTKKTSICCSIPHSLSLPNTRRISQRPRIVFL